MQERKKRTVQLAVWTWSWVATLALATFGPKFIWENQPILTPIAIILNFLIGLLMILANRRLFNNFDELERKIHLEALAITLGLTVVVGLSYSLLDSSNLINFDAEIGLLVGFIGVSYMTALLLNNKRYQ